MMRNGGTATYQRPKPSRASLTKFTRFILLTKVFTVYCRQEFAATRVPSIVYDRTRRGQLSAFEKIVNMVHGLYSGGSSGGRRRLGLRHQANVRITGLH